MSNVLTSDSPRWLPAAELRAMGFEACGPEIDYGMRWGEHRDIRVSFSPYDGRDDGYLYAHDRSADRYLIVAAHTTAERVDAAWRELNATTSSPDAYLVLASLDHGDRPMPVTQARSLLLHCVDRELAAHHDYVAGGNAGQSRFDTAHSVVVQRSARVAAEDLQLAAVRADIGGGQPVVVRYRILGQSGWVGRVAGSTLESACAETRHVQDTAFRHQLDVQATSLSHGHSIVAAARIRELEFATPEPPAPAIAPQIAF
jgi:hypothetical protein